MPNKPAAAALPSKPRSVGDFHHSLARAVRPVWRSTLANIRPILLIQGGGLLLVLAYYSLTSFRAVCQSIAEWKKQSNPAWASLSCILAAVILPELAKCLTGPRPVPNRAYFRHLLVLCGFFALGGFLVDRFYLLQAWIFGDNTLPLTILKKVLVDQFIYSAFWCAPYAVLWFLWEEENLSFARTWRRINLPLLTERIPAVVVANWIFWIPLITCIYCLPVGLQFPVCLAAQGAWSLLLVTLTRAPHHASTT